MTGATVQVRAGRTAAEVEANGTPAPGPVGAELSRRILGEGPLALDVAAVLGKSRGGRPVHRRTLLGWIEAGSRRADGSRVHLEACRIGARWFTSGTAIERFVAGCQGS